MARLHVKRKAAKVTRTKLALLTAQLHELKNAAKTRGLKVEQDKRLQGTPYISMNPRAAKELHQPCRKRAITFWGERSLQHEVMDIRHELIEYDEMGKGKPYKVGHKIANRKQRTVNVV